MNFQAVLSRAEASTTSLIEQARQSTDPLRAERLLRHHLHQLLLQAGAIGDALGHEFCTEDVAIHTFDAPAVIRGRSAVAAYWAEQCGPGGVLLFDELRVAADDWGVLTEQVHRNYRTDAGGASLVSRPVATVNVFGPRQRIEEIRIYPAKRADDTALPPAEAPAPAAAAASLAPLIARTRALLR